MSTRRKSGFQLALLVAEALIFFASGIALYVVISRVAGPELLGQYTLVLSWMTVFQAFGSFGIPELMLTELGRHPDARSEYLGAGLALGMATSLCLVPIMMLVTRLMHYDPAMETALTVAAFSLPGAMLLNVARSGFIAGRHLEFVLTTRVVEFVLVLPASLVLLFHGAGIVALAVTTVSGRAVGALLGLALLHRCAIPVTWWPGRARVRAVARAALTYGSSNALGLFGTHVNVIMLSVLAPIAQVGYFVAGFKLVESLALVVVLFGQFFMPRIAHSLTHERALALEPFRKVFRLLFVLMAPIGIGLVMFPEFVVGLLYGEGFGPTIDILRLMGVFYLVYCADALLSLILKSAELQALDLRLLVANPTVNVSVNFVLIPVFGAFGAAIGQFSGGLCSLALRYGAVSRRVGSPGWVTLGGPAVLASLVVGAGIASSMAQPGLAGVSLYGVIMLGMIAATAWFTLRPLTAANANPPGSRGAAGAPEIIGKEPAER